MVTNPISWIAFGLVLGSSMPALAHTTGISYADIDIGQRQADIRLRMNLRELQFARDLDQNADQIVTAAEAKAGFPRHVSRLLDNIRIKAGGEEGRGQLNGIDFSPELGEIECRLEYAFRQFVDGNVSIMVSLHDLTDSGHWSLARIRYDGHEEQLYFNLESPRVQLMLLRSSSSYIRLASQYLGRALRRLGRNPDLLVFLAGLVVIGNSWKTFVLPAASLLLAQLAAFVLSGWSGALLPRAFVNSALALSIVYIAAENLLIKDVTHRSWIAGFFGLIYGMSFASVIQESGLPEKGQLTALLGYQTGIALSLIGTLAIIFGLTTFLVRFQRQRRIVVLTSLGFMVLGTYEFVQRTF
jgi:hypothetical protein